MLAFAGWRGNNGTFVMLSASQTPMTSLRDVVHRCRDHHAGRGNRGLRDAGGSRLQADRQDPRGSPGPARAGDRAGRGVAGAGGGDGRRAPAARFRSCRTSCGSSRGPADGRLLGLYGTRRPGSGSRPYRTVLPGVDPIEGRCDCPDFLKNSLGLCKHISWCSSTSTPGLASCSRRSRSRSGASRRAGKACAGTRSGR